MSERRVAATDKHGGCLIDMSMRLVAEGRTICR